MISCTDQEASEFKGELFLKPKTLTTATVQSSDRNTWKSSFSCIQLNEPVLQEECKDRVPLKCPFLSPTCSLNLQEHLPVLFPCRAKCQNSKNAPLLSSRGAKARPVLSGGGSIEAYLLLCPVGHSLSLLESQHQ